MLYAVEYEMSSLHSMLTEIDSFTDALKTVKQLAESELNFLENHFLNGSKIFNVRKPHFYLFYLN